MIIDLTHTLKNNITRYPGTPEPRFDQVNTHAIDGYSQLKVTLTTHTGTHIDAPFHILPEAKSLDEFPLEKFVGRGLSLNCMETGSLSLDILKPWGNALEEVDYLLFYTGWQQKWNTPEYFDDFPVLTQEAVEWLLNFRLQGVGFDTISVDAMESEHLPNHKLLLKKEILIIENMTNLDQLIGKHFELNCIPLKIDGTDGSPVRAFARL